MNQFEPLIHSSAIAHKEADKTALVILAPNDAQGKLVLQGIFGRLVSKDEVTNQVEVILDEQLVNCSSIFSSYSGGATFMVSATEAIIVQSDDPFAIDSLKATLTASLAQNWGARYESLKQGAGQSMRQALDMEMATALNAAQALIDSKQVSSASIPVSAFTIASESVGNLTEIVLLKESTSRTIEPEQLTDATSGFAPNRELANLPEQKNLMVYRHDGHLNVLLKKGVSAEAFSSLLAQSDEALMLVLEQLKANFSDTYTLIPAGEAAEIIERIGASRVSETFAQALNEYEQSQFAPRMERINF